MTAKLSGVLPSGDANGVHAIVPAMIDDPGRVHVLVVLADCVSVRHNIDDGSRVPTVRIRRIEAVTDPGDRDQLQRLLMREFERRTGQPVLPFELESDVRAAFDDGTGDDGPEEPPPPRRRKRT